MISLFNMTLGTFFALLCHCGGLRLICVVFAAPYRWRRRSAWTASTRLCRAWPSPCGRAPRGPCSSSHKGASTTYSWWAWNHKTALGSFFRSHMDPFCRVVFQRLDVEKETIELVHSNPTETCDLPRSVPKDTPRYHLFLYKHSHEGDYLESVGMSLIIFSAKHARVHSEAHIWSPDRERGAHARSYLHLHSNTGFTVNKLEALQRSVL